MFSFKVIMDSLTIYYSLYLFACLNGLTGFCSSLVFSFVCAFQQHTGVLGLFNCPGGGWCRQSRRNKCASQFCCLVTCSASPKDIEWTDGKKENEEASMFAVYMFREEKLKLLKFAENLEVSLDPLNFELLTVSPVKVLPRKSVQFAAIGLVNMLNTGGAVQSMDFTNDGDLVRIGVRGSGEMKVFALVKPVTCKIDGVSVKFGYEDRMVSVQVPWPSSQGESVVEYIF